MRNSLTMQFVMILCKLAARWPCTDYSCWGRSKSDNRIAWYDTKVDAVEHWSRPLVISHPCCLMNLLACFSPHCWGSDITSRTNNYHCCLFFANREHSTIVCLTSTYHLSIFASACLVLSSHRVFLPVFRCTAFWLWPHGRNTGAYVAVQALLVTSCNANTLVIALHC